MRRSIFCALALVLCACGGGGGGSGDSGDAGDVTFFGGVWTGTADIIQNSCGLPFDDTLNFRNPVNQDGAAVVVNAAGGGTYAGTVIPGEGFVASSRSVDEECDITSSIGYTEISDDGTATVILGIDENCSGLICHTSYAGTGTRISGE